MVVSENKQLQKNLIDLSGVFPPVPTPFDETGDLALGLLDDNFSYWSKFNLSGYVILGSNGEFVLLSDSEKRRVFEAARKLIPADRLLIVGTGCQSTADTVALTLAAAQIGADAALVLSPFYYKGQMDARSLTAHFFTVADVSPIPLLIYNMPANTGIDLDAHLIARLSEHPNIVGLKDSGGNITKIALTKALTGPRFQILAGSAGFLLPALLVGAVGGIMALANIAPAQCLAIRDHFLSNNLDLARELQLQVIPVNTAVTRRWGVPGLKAAMDTLGLRGGAVRLPLQPLLEDAVAELKTILESAGLN